ncbi:biotin transporter BioY [Pelosinus sp. IPA-1]|uniref:biotin transporter BioY n=1 Tax=Pelosinus sp. IPA-1 TaxID=3029569 RepID=UPI002436157D|nr:biotin transporter BioY [Pelosinus sp. IPA-1]GMB01173.1 biotin transporter BioY [Pelosinus sp. IPA-1]
MKLTLREMILISIFAALTAVGAFIKIPTPLVPFTLQFLFCAYSGIFLGGSKGLYSQLLYVSIGLMGIPIFASGGGPTYILQPTFGYLLGFMTCSYTVGRLVQNFTTISFMKIFSSVLLGLLLVYLCGVGYLYLIVNFYLHKQMTLQAAIGAGFLPYITSDLILSVIISLTAVRIIPILKKSGYYISAH